MDKPKNILILKYRALGDSLIGLSGLKYLRELYPDANIIYGMPKWCANLYKNVKTDADEILGLDLETPISWFELYLELRKRNIELVFEMFQSGRTSTYFNLYSKITGAKYLFHNHHPGNETDVLDQGKIKPVIQRDLDGIYSQLGNGESPNYLDFPPSMKSIGSGQKQFIIFGVVATRQTKMWDLKRYAELSKIINNSFPQYRILIPISNSIQDQKIKSELLSLEVKAQFVERPLSELPEIFEGSRLYIGNDTGLKHLAISLGVKSFTLFGPEPPLEWHPYDKEKHPYFFLENLECRTKDAHYCGLSTCDTMLCLREFTPEYIYSQISPFLE